MQKFCKAKMLVLQLIKIIDCIILEHYQNYLIENGAVQEQIININFEDIDYDNLTDYKKTL